MDLKNKVSDVLNRFKTEGKLTPEILKDVPYINLHAHSTYSLQDAVGQVHLHFEETIEKNHCGCCITDHGSYASFADLWTLSKKPTKKASRLLQEKGRSKHDVVYGAELYIFDNRHEKILRTALKDGDGQLIYNHVSKMKLNSKWAGLFDVKGKASATNEVDVSESEDTKGVKVGTELLNGLIKKNGNLEEMVEAFIAKARRINSYKYNHITIHVKNYEGHRNLCELTSLGYLPHKFYSRPRIDLTDLLEKKEGLIVTSGCLVGMIPHAINLETGEEEELLELFLKEFGDDFYVELHISNISHDWSPALKKHVPIGENLQEGVNERLIGLARKFGISDKIYIAQDSHMPKASDKKIQDVLLINDKKNKNGWHFYNTYSVMTVSEMHEEVRAHYPSYTDEEFLNWCLNSIEILLKCRDVKINTEFKLKKPFYKAHQSVNPVIPSQEYLDENFSDNTDKLVADIRIKLEFADNVESALSSKKVDREKTLNQIEKIEDAKKTLESIFEEHKDNYYVQKAKRFYEQGDEGTIAFCLGGLVNGRWEYTRKELVEDFFFQLNTLQYNGILPVSDYFLHFEDFAKVVMASRGMTSPGRGSSAGCYLAYTTAITQILPRDYGLLFERFLLEERIGILFFDHSRLPEDVTKEGDYSAFDTITKLLKDVQVSKDLEHYLEKEMYYLERKPGVCHYLLKLKEVADKEGSPLKNEKNSTVCFLLGICERPTKEITKTEPAMPDIDFDTSCRDIICEFLQKLHGVDHFAYICSYGSLRPVSSLKEILRIVPLENGTMVSPDEANFITNEMGKVKASEEILSEGDLAVLHYILENNNIVSNFFKQNPHILENLEKMLGTYKNSGLHAGGVILSEDPIFRDCPCFWDKAKNSWVTQLDKKVVEKIGFVKKDILGLKTLEVMADCVERIRKDLGIDYSNPIRREEVLRNLPESVFDALRKRRTDGIFQAGTPICQSMLGRIRINETPSPVKLFSGVTAVGRPGPMGEGAHISFIDSINGVVSPSYTHPALEPILSETFGIIVYQEQVMKICQVLGNFSLLESDNVRKAMGKKDFKLLAKFEEVFIAGAIKNGMGRDDAKTLWDKLVKFAEYGFNKSHAVAYSAVTCFSVYLSEKYPLQWRASLVDQASRENKKDDFALYYKLWKDVIRTPNISLSGDGYEITNSYIQMPLYAIKSVNKEVSSQISKLKPFKTFKEFYFTAKFKTNADSNFFEAIIFSGAIDALMPSQREVKEKLLKLDVSALEGLEEIASFAKVIYEKEDDLTPIYEYIDFVESGVRVSEKNKIAFESAVNGLESLKVPMGVLLYRKFLWYVYMSELKALEVSSKIKTALKGIEVSPDDTISLYQGKAIHLTRKYPELMKAVLATAVSYLGVKVKRADLAEIDLLSEKELEEIHPELALIKREHRSASIPDGAFLKLPATLKPEVVEKINEYKNLNLKLMVLKQMEFLQFSTYDMTPIFEEEIQHIKRDLQANVLSPEKADELGRQLDDILSWATNYCHTLIKDPLLNEFSDEDIVVREKYLSQFFEDSQARFGWSYKRNALAIIEKTTKELDKKSEFRHRFSRSFLKMFVKSTVPTGGENFLIPLANILDNDELRALASIRKLSQSATEINSSKKLALDMDGIIRFAIAKIISEEDEVCSLIPKNKTLSLVAREIQKCIEQNNKIPKALSAIKMPEEIISLTRSVIKVFTNGVSSELMEKIEEVKLEMTRLDISNEMINFITDGVYVFGTVFREEKKKFIRERVYNNTTKVSMNIFLNGETASIPTTIDNFKSIKLVDIKGDSVDLVEKMKNYTPVILKVRGVIDGFTNSLKLQVIPHHSAIKFIIDNID